MAVAGASRAQGDGVTARAKRPATPARRSPGNTRLREADRAHLAAAEALRPGFAPADVRSEVIALGRAAMEAGGRIEPARAVLPPGEGIAIGSGTAIVPDVIALP